MRYILLILFFVCIALTPFVAHAIEKPVIYYSFDNIRGDAIADLSGFGNDGTLEDNPKIVDGKFGKGLEFESSRVTTPTSDSLNPNLFQSSFTLVVWINPKRTGDDWQQIMMTEGLPKARDTIFINNDGRLSWRGRVGGNWAGGMCETDPGVVEADKWTHVAVVGDTKNFRIYVDGKLTKESAFQTTDGGNENHYIGGNPTILDESYSGAVDEFAIFTVPLKEADIVAIKDNGLASIVSVELKGKIATKWATLKNAF
jgi:hypothetical protein